MANAVVRTLRSYRDLFTVPGSRGFVVAGLVRRYPISMRELAALVLVLHATQSYAVAGAVSSIVTLTNAASVPLLGRTSDRPPFMISTSA